MTVATKAEKILKVKDWFAIKNYTHKENMIMVKAVVCIVNQVTQKAVSVTWINSDQERVTKWVPKSCFENY